jgi:hypothetical protein
VPVDEPCGQRGRLVTTPSDLPPAARPLHANEATQRAAADYLKALAKVDSQSVTQLHCCTSHLSASVNPPKRASGLATFRIPPSRGPFSGRG